MRRSDEDGCQLILNVESGGREGARLNGTRAPLRSFWNRKSQYDCFFHLNVAIVKKSMTLFRKKMGRHCDTPFESYDANAEYATSVAFNEKAMNPY